MIIRDQVTSRQIYLNGVRDNVVGLLSTGQKTWSTPQPNNGMETIPIPGDQSGPIPGDQSGRSLIIATGLQEDTSEMNVENTVLEEHDLEFDVMLQKMVGTIKSKPGGKPVMGEAFIVQKYNRLLPKVRSPKEESGDHGQKPAHPGTLTIAHLQEIMLLHQGKSTDHKGAMDIQDIAKKFGVDAAQVEKIIQSVSLPPEYKNKDTEE